MNDQADRLRQIIENLKARQYGGNTLTIDLPKKNAKIITVTSGKGGVGKTNVTVNLAIALSELGYRVVIMDADFGFANIDILFGIIPEYTLLDVIYNRKGIMEILSKGPQNIQFISGGSGVEELVKLDREKIEKFIQNMVVLDSIADIILVDTGAGLSDSVMSFVLAADEVIVVTTPEPTAITDAYALIKMISHRDKGKLIKVVVNRAEDELEAEEILEKLFVVANKFLKMNLEKLGFILKDESVVKAVKIQQPFTISYPKSSASRQIREITRKLVNVENTVSNTNSGGIKAFVSRLVKFMSN